VKSQMVHSVVAASLFAAALALSSEPGDAQVGNKAASPPIAKVGGLRRTADGKPNLSGVWQGPGWNTGGVQAKSLPGGVFPGPPPSYPPPPRQPIPYQKWALEKSKQFREEDDPSFHCLLPGLPRAVTAPYPFEIVQTPEKIVVLYESSRVFRIIPIITSLKHPDDLVPTWMGDSVGRWDGDILVVDVVGFNDKTWLGGVGSIHTEALHIVERYRLNPDHTLSWEARVEDPKVLTKPWVLGAFFRTPPNVRIEEYECLENNQDPGLLQLVRKSAK